MSDLLPMKRLLLDCDTLLNSIQKSDPDRKTKVQQLFDLEKSGAVELYLINYFFAELRGCGPAYRVEEMVAHFRNQFGNRIITPTTGNIENASKVDIPKGYRSALQMVCAQSKSLDAIVSDNVEEFANADVVTWSLEEMQFRCAHVSQQYDLERIYVHSPKRTPTKQQNLQVSCFQDPQQYDLERIYVHSPKRTPTKQQNLQVSCFQDLHPGIAREYLEFYNPGELWSETALFS